MASALSLQAVTVHRGKRAVLSQIDCTVEFGELIALIGPNGAGKTTLLETIAGFHRYQGSIALQGRSLSALTPIERAQLLAYVPQLSRLDVPMAAIDVVRQGRFAFRNHFGKLAASDEHIVREAMASTRVDHLAERAYTQLSYGERRRVLLARALATSAKVIMLDEPSSSLDIGQALALFETLRALTQQGHAMVAVLHHLDEALRFADRALLLHQGQTVALGTTAEVVCSELVGRVYGVELHRQEALAFRLAKAR